MRSSLSPLLALALAALAVVLVTGCGESRATPTATLTRAAPTATLTRATPTATFTRATPTATLTRELEGLESVLDEVGRKVAKLRGLEVLKRVPVEIMSRSRLEAFLVEKIDEKDREDIHKAQSLFTMMNLVPEGTDLYRLYLDLLTEQILGLYDPETEKVYLVQDAEKRGPLLEATLAHEYVHALQQQHFDIHSLREKAKKLDSETEAALAALIEGDAVIVQTRYMLENMTAQEMQEVASAGGNTPVFDRAPHVIRQALLFPYEVGSQFVLALMGQGNQKAIDGAFRRPPTSTSQVLHPEKYFRGQAPEPVSLPDFVSALGEGWFQLDDDILGEFFLRTYLETGTSRELAAKAAQGWATDRYVLLRGPGDQRLLVARILWDSEEDAQEFLSVALAPLANGSHLRHACLQSNQVILLVASTDAVLRTSRSALSGC